MKKKQETVNTPEGVFSRLSSKLINNMKISSSGLKLFVDNYVTKTWMRQHGVVTSKTHFDKVNLYTSFLKEQMTVKVFFKLLRVLPIKRVTLTVTVVSINDKEYSASDTTSFFIDDKETDDVDATV